MSNGKLSKDELQKIVLSAIGFVALLYVYSTFFLGPLTKSRASMEKSIADVQGRLDSSKTEMVKAKNLEKQATAAIDRFAALKALSPEGAAIAWFPPRLRLFLAARQIEKAAVRPESNGTFKQAELAEWSRYTWLVDMPKTDFISVGAALAELENSEPLLFVSRLSMKSIPESPQYQQATFSANVAIAKR